jgi:type II secretory pathway pseudopilin PulG
MPHDETGGAAFTLTEVVIAVVLMLLALGLLLSGFISSKRSVSLMQTRLTAMQIAQREAERLQTNAYTNIVSAATILTNKFIVYTMSNSVFSVTNATANKYKDIVIVIAWTDPASSRRQALTNYITICNTN